MNEKQNKLQRTQIVLLQFFFILFIEGITFAVIVDDFKYFHVVAITELLS